MCTPGVYDANFGENFGDVVAEVENYLTSGMTFDKIAARKLWGHTISLLSRAS